jgi:hypothetical protein
MTLYEKYSYVFPSVSDFVVLSRISHNWYYSERKIILILPKWDAAVNPTLTAKARAQQWWGTRIIIAGTVRQH